MESLKQNKKNCVILDEPCFKLHEFWQCCIMFKDFIEIGRTSIRAIMQEYNYAIENGGSNE